MPQERPDRTATVQTSTSPSPQRLAPPWFARALLLLRFVEAAGLGGSLRALRVERPRAGTYVAVDFLLPLLLYGLSGEPTLKDFFAALKPVKSALAALLLRAAVPSRAALSRFLGVVDAATVATMRRLLLDAVCVHGLRGAQLGGWFDRQGERHLVLDYDGTYQPARQRSLVQSPRHPTAKRRLGTLCKPGHLGRKRGDAVRTRFVLHQAHTGEWLGTWGAPGNGDPVQQLHLAADAALHYARALGLRAAQLLVRLDGQFGYLPWVWTLTERGLGYLVRCADYRLLDDPAVQARLALPHDDTVIQPDTGLVREVWDLGPVRWVEGQGGTRELLPRLLVTRRPLPKNEAVRVGKRVGDGVFELFVTDRVATAFSAKELVMGYFARGGFEGVLGQEDRFEHGDRWVSGHEPGQELWQLLAQFVGNARLWLAVRSDDVALRVTDWLLEDRDDALAAAPTTPVVQLVCMPANDAPVANDNDRARDEPAAKRFGPEDFRFSMHQLLQCPAGAVLRPVAQRRVGERLRVDYAAEVKDCAACAWSERCRGHVTPGYTGRHVRKWLPLLPSDASVQASPEVRVQWRDVAASTLRREWTVQTQSQGVEVQPAQGVRVVLTRGQRARRRLTWAERLARNAHPPCRVPWKIVVAGVPPQLERFLDNLQAERAAA